MKEYSVGILGATGAVGQTMLKVLAERHNIQMPKEELLLEANKWELSHGGLSGRTAQQFIDYLLGK